MFNQTILGNFYTEGEATPPPETKPDEKPGEVFTQEQVNAMLAEHKRNLRKELDDLKKAGDPVALQKKIKELSDAMLTKEELAKQKAEELKTTYDEQVKNLAGEKEAWMSRYNGLYIKNEITKGAAKHDAFDPEQLELLIGPNTKVVEVTDDSGKGTGQFKVLTTIEVDGKKLELPTADAIGKLRESNRFPNQFRVKGQPGTGTTLNNMPNPEMADGNIPQNMEGFMKFWNAAKKDGRI